MTTYNRPSGATTAELHERAVAALVREWGITEQQARDALNHAINEEHRLRRRRVA